MYKCLIKIKTEAYQKHCIEFLQGGHVYEEIPALSSTHHLVGNKDEMQLVASEKQRRNCLMADLHVGPILGYLLRRSEIDNVVCDREEPVNLSVPSRPRF